MKILAILLLLVLAPRYAAQLRGETRHGSKYKKELAAQRRLRNTHNDERRLMTDCAGKGKGDGTSGEDCDGADTGKGKGTMGSSSGGKGVGMNHTVIDNGCGCGCGSCCGCGCGCGYNYGPGSYGKGKGGKGLGKGLGKGNTNSTVDSTSGKGKGGSMDLPSGDADVGMNHTVIEDGPSCGYGCGCRYRLCQMQYCRFDRVCQIEWP